MLLVWIVGCFCDDVIEGLFLWLPVIVYCSIDVMT